MSRGSVDANEGSLGSGKKKSRFGIGVLVGIVIGAVTFDYFPFPVSDKTQMTEDILRQVCPNARQWELIRELSYLGIESEVLWRPFETMSNGEQTKALLAALFLKEEHFLLIDEPTNHLDLFRTFRMNGSIFQKINENLFD